MLLFALGCTEYEDGERYLTIDLAINCADASPGDSADAGITWLVLFTGIPAVLAMLYSCIRPDSADKRLSQGRQTAAVGVMGKVKKCVAQAHAKATARVDWEAVEHQLMTMVADETLDHALIDTEAFTVHLLRAELHARVGGGSNGGGSGDKAPGSGADTLHGVLLALTGPNTTAAGAAGATSAVARTRGSKQVAAVLPFE